MSCPRERELALYVEDDLPVSEVAAVQAHVLDCAICRSFLLSLEASQQALKALAAEPIADEALAALRERAGRVPAADRRSVGLRWAMAAAVALALLPGLYLAVSRREAPTAPVRIAEGAPAPRVTVRSPTPAPPAPVVAPDSARRPMASRPERPSVAEEASDVPLTSAEADQLARALVAVSRIEKLSDIDRHPPEPLDPALVRVASDDPNVVIYWRLEPSGGK